MKKTLLIFAILFYVSCSLVFGQKKSNSVDITWYKTEKEKDELSSGYIVGHDDTGIYRARHLLKEIDKDNIKHLTLEHYDADMIKTKSVEIQPKYKGKDMSYEFVINTSNKLYLFTSLIENQSAKKYLFVQALNKNSLELDSEPRKVIEVDLSHRKQAVKRGDGRFAYKVSHDESKILILYEVPFFRPKLQYPIGFSVFDDNMQEIWSKTAKLMSSGGIFSGNVVLNNAGDVYALENRYQVFGYFDNGETQKIYALNSEEYTLGNMRITINVNEDIFCGGTYSNKGIIGETGIYLYKINGDSKENVVERFVKFNDKVIANENLSKKRIKKGEILFSYSWKNMMIRDDGGVLLFGEYYSKDSSKFEGNTTHSHYYKNIVVVSVNQYGDVEWMESTKKRQYTSNHSFGNSTSFSSYIASVVDDKVYLIFNDNLKNIDNDSRKVHNFKTNGENAVVTIVELSKTDKQKREVLFMVEDTDFPVVPSNVEQVSRNELFIFNGERFCKLVFK